MSVKHSMFATGITPKKCQECATPNYRPHPLSSLLVTIGIGLSFIFIATAILVTKNVVFYKVFAVFGLSIVAYSIECMLIPLKLLDVEKKNKIERRELLWMAIFFGILFILAITIP